jgi:hypothetical protein
MTASERIERLPLLDSIKRLKFCLNEVSGFSRESGENCAFLVYYAERVVFIPYRRFVKTYLFHLQGSRIPVGMLLGFMGCTETSLRNHH